MARRTVQAGYLARRIEALRAGGLTRAQVAAQTGIGERTQRKLIAGETPGSRVYRRIVPAGLGRAIRRGVDIPRSAEPGHFSIVVRRADGSYARVPVTAPASITGSRARVKPLDSRVVLGVLWSDHSPLKR